MAVMNGRMIPLSDKPRIWKSCGQWVCSGLATKRVLWLWEKRKAFTGWGRTPFLAHSAWEIACYTHGYATNRRDTEGALRLARSLDHKPAPAAA